MSYFNQGLEARCTGCVEQVTTDPLAPGTLETVPGQVPSAVLLGICVLFHRTVTVPLLRLLCAVLKDEGKIQNLNMTKYQRWDLDLWPLLVEISLCS